MKKIKILFILEAVGGGALQHLQYLTTGLNQELFDITVILNAKRPNSSIYEIKSLEIAGVRIVYFPINRSMNFFKHMLMIRTLHTTMKKECFDIAHAHSAIAGIFLRLANLSKTKIKIVYTPHCFNFQGKQFFFTKYISLLVEAFLSRNTHKIIVSEHEKDALSRYTIINSSKIVVINNAIPIKSLNNKKNATNTKEMYGINPHAYIVGSVGRLSKQKDWETYLKAAKVVVKQAPKTVFLIVGEGELSSEIKKLITTLSLVDNVIMTGFVREIDCIYEIIDVLVCCSLWEGLPYVFLEAMRHKKPIITTNTANFNAIEHQYNGFITAAKDYLTIANHILQLNTDRDLGLNMGENGFTKLRKTNSLDTFIIRHEILYKELVSGN